MDHMRRHQPRHHHVSRPNDLLLRQQPRYHVGLRVLLRADDEEFATTTMTTKKRKRTLQRRSAVAVDLLSTMTMMMQAEAVLLSTMRVVLIRTPAGTKR